MSRPANEIYRLLASKNHGIPQFTPEPNENLPLEYQHVGVGIGDVGVWTDDSFDVIFNACQPSTSSINAQAVPPYFDYFPLPKRDISKRMYHSPGTIITAGKLRRMEMTAETSSTVTPLPVTLGAGVTFEVQSKECAILVLPEGASRQRLLATQTFRAHVQKNAQQWYTLARDRVPPQGSLFVVTGCDKTASWGIATVASRSGCISTSLKFSVAGMVEGSAKPTYEWRDFGSATVRTSRNYGFPRTENQCIFIEGFFVPKEVPRLVVMQKVLRSFRKEEKEVTRRIGGHLGSERVAKLERQCAVDASASEGILITNESENSE